MGARFRDIVGGNIRRRIGSITRIFAIRGSWNRLRIEQGEVMCLESGTTHDPVRSTTFDP